jgi:hypothetical protein
VIIFIVLSKEQGTKCFQRLHANAYQSNLIRVLRSLDEHVNAYQKSVKRARAGTAAVRSGKPRSRRGAPEAASGVQSDWDCQG